MYFKTIRKYCKAENTTHKYYRLSESYRDEFGITRQHMVMGIGRASMAAEGLDLVKLKTLKNKNIREIGAESICFQAFH